MSASASASHSGSKSTSATSVSLPGSSSSSNPPIKVHQSAILEKILLVAGVIFLLAPCGLVMLPTLGFSLSIASASLGICFLIFATIILCRKK